MENFERKCQETAKYLPCKKNDGNLFFHSGNYRISFDLIFLHFAGGVPKNFKEKMEQVSGDMGILLTYEIMSFSNFDEVKKYLVRFQIKNIFVLGCNRSKSASLMASDKVPLFNQ